MGRGVDNPQLRERLGVPSFRQRWPWIGGDLQTLRDTLREVDLPHDQGVPIEIPVPALPSGAAAAGSLLALLDQPEGEPKGLVLLLPWAGWIQFPGRPEADGCGAPGRRFCGAAPQPARC